MQPSPLVFLSFVGGPGFSVKVESLMFKTLDALSSSCAYFLHIQILGPKNCKCFVGSAPFNGLYPALSGPAGKQTKLKTIILNKIGLLIKSCSKTL